MSAQDENNRYYKTVKKKFSPNQPNESGFRSTLMTRNMSNMISTVQSPSNQDPARSTKKQFRISNENARHFSKDVIGLSTTDQSQAFLNVNPNETTDVTIRDHADLRMKYN
jgi:DUF1009 family protein